MRKFCSLLLVSSAFLIGGCEVVAMGVAAPGILKQEKVNVVNASYAAADTISQQAGKQVLKETPMVVSDLQEIIDMNARTVTAHPKIGRVLAQQMRDRFIQLGYNVVDGAAYRNSAKASELSGTYEIVNSRMNVSLALRDSNNGRIITTYHYSLPVTYDIKKYMTRDANSLPPLPPLI